MTDISELSPINSFSAPMTSLEEQNLGKDDFLNLLVAQLQNQDPLNPSDPTEFTAQLAQFSSLEQQFQMNDSLGQMAVMSADMERLSAMGLIGRDVVSSSGVLDYGGGDVTLGYQLEGGVTDAQMCLVNELGATVASMNLSDLSAGEHYFTWSGRDDSGQVIPAGRYGIEVRAMQGDEPAVGAAALVKGRVAGVDFSPSGSLLVTDAGEFLLNDVIHATEG
ncbi:MAG: flagellar hook capping protein [Desulfuromonas sp.]|uniref:flagellar hook assembly protein FlgD n=1 Tax=Desulfuromonas sp. TaxID=892 RepID=UPI000CAFB5EC|nr:flagellar hook assembly protein FlgD [Desulfuromonas sp.]PLX84493.1 MAG: flagellar hook capping protein [Desulfuromonas sp.]